MLECPGDYFTVKEVMRRKRLSILPAMTDDISTSLSR
jgi:hypothetical protein